MIRWLRICVLLTLITAFTILTVFVINGDMQSFNIFVYDHIKTKISPMLTNVMIGISSIGDKFVYVPSILLLLIIPQTRKKMGVPMLLTVSTSALLNYLIKNAFSVPRPDINRLIEISGYGYPSGHAMNSVTFFGLGAFLFYRYAGNHNQKITAVTFSFSFILLVGLSRIYLGVHTATDVISGYLAGTFVLTSAVFIIKYGRTSE